MVKAILFDMDGTLVDDSMDTFLPSYFAALTKKLASVVAPDKFIAQLQASTRAMVASNDPARTMADAFAADFFPKIGVPRETLMPLLDDFYVREYPQLRAYVKPIPRARDVIARAIQRSHPVVIATMPVFPRTAIRQRMEWGHIADFPYALVTCYANQKPCTRLFRRFPMNYAVVIAKNMIRLGFGRVETSNSDC